MSGIRRRLTSMDSVKKAQDSGKRQSVQSSSNETRKNLNTHVVLCIAIIIASAFFLLYRRENASVASTYALCSKEGNIYTGEESNPRLECLVVSNGVIADTGSILEIKQRWRDNGVSSGFKFHFVPSGSVIVPGLADAHGHIIEYGFTTQLNLYGCRSIQEIIQRIRSYLDQHPEAKANPSEWILGFGWNQNIWSPTGEFPTAMDLDSDPILKGRLIALTRIDGHASWVSSAVLKLMYPLPDTVDGGNIVRDKNGSPTGIFVDNAMSLILIPEMTFDLMKRYFTTAMNDAVAHGLTVIHDAGSPPEQIDFFRTMADQKSVPIRLYIMGRIASNDYWGDKIPRLHNYGPAGRLTVRSIKLVSDGALGSWGAAMIEPYSDSPLTHGLLLTPPDVLEMQVQRFFEDGWQVNVHCIGDQANKNILDIFEKVLKERNVSEVRPRIEHAQIMQLSDLDRTGRLGVLPSVQPTHATSDMGYAELRIGPKRIKGAYAYQTLLQNSPNHILPIGSDFPIESIDPLKGFYAAVARLTPEGTSPHGPDGWYPSERLTRAQALKGMTYDAAYAAFAENEYGSLKKGLKADVVVFDKDIMTVPISEILSAKVRATIVDGEVVYGSI